MLDDYRKAIKKVAKEFFFPVLEGELIEFDFKRDIPDGLHPNANGHRIYADWILDKSKIK